MRAVPLTVEGGGVRGCGGARYLPPIQVRAVLDVCLVEGLGFRAWGFGFRVSGLGFRVQGSGFRVQGRVG